MLSPDHHIFWIFLRCRVFSQDLRLGLVQASQGKVGNIGDQCFYTAITTIQDREIWGRHRNILKLAGLATMLILGTFMFVMFSFRSQDGPWRI